jgi:hypothetical protein
MDMGDRLASGACRVDVGAQIRGKDTEGGGGEALGGDIDVFSC